MAGTIHFWIHYTRMRRLVHGNLRRERVFRDRTNPLDFYDDDEFRMRYRLRKDTTIYLIDMVKDDIEPLSRRGGAIPSHLQVLLTLRFYATGQFHKVSGDLIGVDVASVSRVVRRVTIAIAQLKHLVILFPENHDLDRAKKDFHKLAKFPDVIGAIDCIQIPIVNPGGINSAKFMNKKGFYSVNTQVVCDANMIVTDIVASWPGSTHDSHIFLDSQLCTDLESKPHCGHLLGDNEYACSNSILTPILHPSTMSQIRYNSSHKITRGVIQQLFGVVKRRFHCLRVPLRTKLETSFTIIVALFVLHNIAMGRGDMVETEDEYQADEDDGQDEEDNQVPQQIDLDCVYRNNVIEQHFRY